MTTPRVTIGVLSWNRLHYLRATLESARECIRYPDLEWIVSDNESVEPGLRDYVEGLDWVQHKGFKTQSHPEAMNEIIERATGRYLLLWPEDVQFTVRGEWMREILEILEAHPEIGSVTLDYMRKSTIRRFFQPDPWRERRILARELRRFGTRFRFPTTLRSRNGYTLLTMGWLGPGICESGLPSLTRTDVWRRLGPFRKRGERREVGLVDSSLGAENDMLLRFFERGEPLQAAIPAVPVAADILTDPLGCKAKVRGEYRYGIYMPPPVPPFYYRIRTLDELGAYHRTRPMDFSEGAVPLGFRIPVEKDGDRKKFPLNDSVVVDIRTGRPVDYPLATQGE